MSTEQELQAAETAAEEANAALEDAEAVCRSVEHQRDDVMARWIARISGPIAPVSEARVVRRSCTVAEIPAHVGERDSTGGLRAIVGDRKYATNGHLLLDVDSVEGLPLIPHHPRTVIGERGAKLVRIDTPIVGTPGYAAPIRDFTGGADRIIADARYTTIVEDLFPGVEWYEATDGAGRKLHAVAAGHLVAVVMPIKLSVLDPIATSVPT